MNTPPINQNASQPILERNSGNWISVEERLPENSRITHKRVLIWDENRVRESWFDGECFKVWDAQGIPEKVLGVTHWMPLPEPPLPQPPQKKDL